MADNPTVGNKTWVDTAIDIQVKLYEESSEDEFKKHKTRRSKPDQEKFEDRKINIFDKASVKRQIFNEMRPAKVSKVGLDFELKGFNFKTLLKEDAQNSEPWGYIEGDKKLNFTHKQMRWDKTIIKSGVNPSKGITEKLAVRYKDALGAGIDIKIVQDNYKFQKIVEIASFAALGKIPVDAKYLEIDFEISGDFDLPDGEITDRIAFGENSFIQPIRAWDKSEGEIVSGATGFISGNVITKKIPVSWLKQATFPVMTDTTITFGSENVFSSVATLNISVSGLDSTHFVVAYRDDDGSSHGAARVGVVSGTTISSYGTENVFNAASTDWISVAKLDSTHFIVAYRDLVGDNPGAAKVGETSGTTISSYGSENIFNATDADYISAAALDSTHFVVAYRDVENTNKGTAIVGVTSGTTISSYGAENVFNDAGTKDISAAALDSTHFVVAYEDDGGSDYGGARVGVTSGTTISSYGVENLFNSAITTNISVSILDSTHFVISYRDGGNSNYGTSIVGLTSGTTISSYGAENVFNSGDTDYTSVAGIDSTRFIVGYRNTTGSSYGAARVGVTNGNTTISEYGTENTFNAANTTYISVSTLDDTNFVVGYQDIGNSAYGTGIIGSAPQGWSGKINGVSAPAKINGIAVANIKKVNGVE